MEVVPARLVSTESNKPSRRSQVPDHGKDVRGGVLPISCRAADALHEGPCCVGDLRQSSLPFSNTPARGTADVNAPPKGAKIEAALLQAQGNGHRVAQLRVLQDGHGKPHVQRIPEARVHVHKPLPKVHGWREARLPLPPKMILASRVEAGEGQSLQSHGGGEGNRPTVGTRQGEEQSLLLTERGASAQVESLGHGVRGDDGSVGEEDSVGHFSVVVGVWVGVLLLKTAPIPRKLLWRVLPHSDALIETVEMHEPPQGRHDVVVADVEASRHLGEPGCASAVASSPPSTPATLVRRGARAATWRTTMPASPGGRGNCCTKVPTSRGMEMAMPLAACCPKCSVTMVWNVCTCDTSRSSIEFRLANTPGMGASVKLFNLD